MTEIYEQYSVVEYRKRTGTVYDNYLPNQGLLIYRINSDYNGNAGFDAIEEFDEVYLYRPGSYQTSGAYTDGDLDAAPYNTNGWKTAFNSATNPKPCQSDGTPENTQNINNILYDSETDSYTFFYGDPENRNISVNETELSLKGVADAIGTVTINSSVVWYISIPEEATEWLTVSKFKGLNDRVVIFSTQSSNTGEKPRTTKVTITGNDEIFYVTVTQKIIEEGISNEQITKFSIYPNPANDELQITNYEFREGVVEVFDVSGRVVLLSQTTNDKSHIKFDISALNSGVYFIKITNDQGSSTQRFVKE
jgi:hypothetical protein